MHIRALEVEFTAKTNTSQLSITTLNSNKNPKMSEWLFDLTEKNNSGKTLSAIIAAPYGTRGVSVRNPEQKLVSQDCGKLV